MSHEDPLNPENEGSERVILEIGKRLVIKGHNVTLYTERWKGSSTEVYFEGINIIREGNRFTIHFLLPFFLRKRKFDVIINDSGMKFPWVSPLLFGKSNLILYKNHISAFIDIDDNYRHGKLRNFKEKIKFIIYKHRTIIVESKATEKYLISLGVDRSYIKLIKLGTDTENFYPEKKQEKAQLVYYYGNVRQDKGNYVLLVYKSLLDIKSDLKLVVIGEGKRINKLKQLSASSGLDIIFEETRDSARISELLRQSWVNINFFNNDGKGYSILDASASGTPTIAYRILNVSELVKDNCNGFLVNHLYEFKERIMYTIINEEYLSKCSREMAEKANWDSVADAWNEVLNKYTELLE